MNPKIGEIVADMRCTSFVSCQHANDECGKWANKLEALGGWQDISTAPKDGSEFIGLGNNYGDADGARGFHRVISYWESKTGTFTGDAGDCTYLTKWQPLPAQPKQGESNET